MTCHIQLADHDMSYTAGSLTKHVTCVQVTEHDMSYTAGSLTKHVTCVQVAEIDMLHVYRWQKMTCHIQLAEHDSHIQLAEHGTCHIQLAEHDMSYTAGRT